MTESKKIPVTMGGYQVGWAYTIGGELSIDIEDEEAYKKISEGTLEGLTINEN